MPRILFATLMFLLLEGAAICKTLTVGPGKTYPTPCAAFAGSADGDTIEIDASKLYEGDVCAIYKNGLTVRGIGGRARLSAAGKSSQGKAIWVIAGNDTTVENIEFFGCRVPDRNGAGIRMEGVNLTLRNCFFHDNEDGILTGRQPLSEILIENSEFAGNGAGDGQSHNIYVGEIKKFTLRFSYSHHSPGGQLVKSRARENTIVYNRLTDEQGSNYKIDLPNGGTAFVIGNYIQQSASTTNSNLVSFGAEGPTPDSRLYVINNTLVNDRWTGTFIAVNSRVAAPAVVINNIFAGPGILCNQRSAELSHNSSIDPQFIDRAHYDYRLKKGSPCVNAGMEPGSAGGVSLKPEFEYVHPLGSRPRKSAGAIDIGASEQY